MRRSHRKQPEKRRPLVEFNLVGDAKASRRVPRGCASLLSRVLLGIALLITVGAGLSQGAVSV